MTEATQPPVPDERVEAAAQAALCADLLALGRPLALWSAALAALVLGLALHGGAVSALALVSLAPAAVAAWFGLRVRLDAAIFQRWAARWAVPGGEAPTATMAAFDRALGRVPAGRPLAARCRGARRLLIAQALAVAVQTAGVALAAMYIR